MRRDIFKSGAVFFLAAAALVAPASARSEDVPRESPIVVEMFVSQACKKSPPAVEQATALSQRPDLIVLSWHVDYWNVLSNKKDGRWKDPFSNSDFGARQRLYNRSIRNRTSVFTPQAIISGVVSAVGSKTEAIEESVKEARDLQQPVDFQFSRNGNILSVTIGMNSSVYHDVILVNFKDHAVTDVKGGDNAHRTFREVNVVTGVTRLGRIGYDPETFSMPAPAEGMGCAVLVQERPQGAILGASYCP